MKKYMLRVAIVIFSILFIASAIKIVDYFVTSKKEEKSFEDIADKVIQPSPESNLSDDAVSDEETSNQVSLDDISIEKMQTLNGDSVGWLHVSGTVINYPVMHTPSEPEKYLHKNFYNKESRSGVPFLDGAQTLNSRNIFIYGHNMKNGTMFWALRKYKNTDFFSKNSEIFLKTMEGIRVYRVFAVINTDHKSEWYNYRGEITEAKFNKMMSYIDKNAVQRSDQSLSYGDSLLTLSTCGGNEKGRLLVIAVREK